VSGSKSAAELCREHQLNPQLLARWKTEFLEKAPLLFKQEAMQRQEKKLFSLSRIPDSIEWSCVPAEIKDQFQYFSWFVDLIWVFDHCPDVTSDGRQVHDEKAGTNESDSFLHKNYSYCFTDALLSALLCNRTFFA
jgi:hypothetical protein